MTIEAAHPSFAHPATAGAYRQWSQTTGHDDPGAVWATLAHYGLVDVDDLVADLPPHDTTGSDSETIERNATIAHIVLAAGTGFADSVIRAREHADPGRQPEPPLGHRISPILTVEIALALLHPGHNDPAGTPDTTDSTDRTWFQAEREWARALLRQPLPEAARQLSHRMSECVIGVFDNAITALRHQLSLITRPTPTPRPWPPLIDTILGQVLLDPVVTESVFVTLARDDTGPRYARLPRGHWLLYRGTPIQPAQRVRGTLTPAGPAEPPPQWPGGDTPDATGHANHQDRE